MADQDYPNLYAELETSARRAADAAVSFEAMLGGTKEQSVPVRGFPDQPTLAKRVDDKVNQEFGQQITAIDTRVGTRLDAQDAEISRRTDVQDAEIIRRANAQDLEIKSRLNKADTHIDERIDAQDGVISERLDAANVLIDERLDASDDYVDAELYRTSNQISGDGDLVLDAQSGQMIGSLPLKRTDAAIFIAGDQDMLRLDSLNQEVVSEKPFRLGVEIREGAEGHTDRRQFPEMHTLPDDESALVFGTKDGSIALHIDTLNRTIKSDFSFEACVEQRPPSVFVDVPPRLERNIDDPDYRLSGRVYQATATIERTGPTRYWSAWRADNQFAGEAPGNFTVLAYSDDNNATVKEYGYFTFTAADDPLNPLPMAQRPGHDKHLVDPMLWKDPEGRLWLFFGVLGNNRHFDGVQGSWAVICQNPNAEFPVWGQPFRLSYFGDPRHPVMVNGKWYLAVDGWRFSAEYPPRYMEHVGPHIYEFDWRNQKLKHVSQLPPNLGASYSGFFETEFVQLADGRVMALLRWTAGDSGILVSYSDDLMKTWTPWVNYLVLAPASSSRFWLGRSPSGRLLVCWNNDTARRTLTLALSDDEGVTWRHRVVLEPNSAGQLTYPVVTFGDDGEIFIAYDNERTSGKRQIHITKVIESEVVAGTSVPSVKIVSDPFNP